MPGVAVSDRVGNLPINSNAQNIADPGALLGSLVSGNDNYWGGGEYVLCRATSALVQFALVVLTASFDATTKKWRHDAAPCPNTANLGQALGVAMTKCSAADQYVWAKIAGVVPINSNAAVAADSAFGIGAAGQAGANSAGKQVLGGRIIGASSTTVVKTLCRADAGSLRLFVPDSEGLFVGCYLSGTGIAAGSTVAAISPDGTEITLSAVTTARVSGTVTGTYNNGTVYYNIAHINRPRAQGAIT